MLFIRLGTAAVVAIVAALAYGVGRPVAVVAPSASGNPSAVNLTAQEPPAAASPSPSPVPSNRARTPQPARTALRRAPAPAPTVSPHVVDGVLVGSRQQELTNRARAASGLKPLAWNQCLAGVAAAHAMEMANAGRIFHGDGVDRDMACALGSHQTGENVGETSGGADDQRIFDAFMRSSGHRANILGPYRYTGTAWVIAPDGTGYVSVEFG